LEEEEAAQLAQLAGNSDRPDDYDVLLACYDDQQLAAARPTDRDVLSARWLRQAARCDSLGLAVCDELAALTRTGPETARPLLEQCWDDVTRQILDEVKVDAYDNTPLESLTRRLNVLSLVAGRQPDAAVLRPIVQRLSRFSLTGLRFGAELLRRAA